MIDKDSDGDGLADGWIDGRIWDWDSQASGTPDPKFRDYNDQDSNDYMLIYPTPTYEYPAAAYKGMNGKFDPWEGEDKNRNHIPDDDESSMIKYDTDKDGLWDGFDVPDTNEVDENFHYGELYYGNPATGKGMPYSGGGMPHTSSNNLRYSQLAKPHWSYLAQTDPMVRDSDDDGLSDLREVDQYMIELEDWIPFSDWEYGDPYVPDRVMAENMYTTAPGSITKLSGDPNIPDTDFDGLSDLKEYLRSNPTDPDSDNDGLSDYEEVGEDGYYNKGIDTNPCDRDTDNDCLCDGWNDGVENELGPAAVNEVIESGEMLWEGAGDSTFWEDNTDYISTDTVEYGELLREDITPVVDKYKTSDPLRKDSDSDGIMDGAEYNYLWRVVQDPFRDSDHDDIIDMREKDSDSDGLKDNKENLDLDDERDFVNIGGNDYYREADATNPDSDGDHLLDWAEPKKYIDTDEDNYINICDKNSNNPEGYSFDTVEDYDQMVVVFRTNAEDLNDDGKIDYGQYELATEVPEWIIIDMDGKTDVEHDGTGGTTDTINLHKYEYEETVTEPEVPPSMQLKSFQSRPSGDACTEARMFIYTPEGFPIFVDDWNNGDEVYEEA
jgi:hypothetical protein